MIKYLSINRVKHKRHTIYVMLNEKSTHALRKIKRIVKYNTFWNNYYVNYQGIDYQVFSENKVNKIYLSEKHTGNI